VIDGYSYWYEHRTYLRARPKEVSEVYSLTKKKYRAEGRFDPQTWRMNIICKDRDELATLEASYAKTTYASRALSFTDNVGDTFTVFFDNLGEIEHLDYRVTIFRIPILLTESEVV